MKLWKETAANMNWIKIELIIFEQWADSKSRLSLEDIKIKIGWN